MNTLHRFAKTVLGALLVLGSAAPLWSQQLGTSMLDFELGASDIPQINQGAVDLAFSPTGHPARTNYTPFDQYDWLIQIGAGLYNGEFPGVKVGLTSTGGTFFDPYFGVSALVLAFPKEEDELRLPYEEPPKEAFWVVGLVPEVGVRLNYPFSDKLKVFAALAWSLPMTVSAWNSAVSLTTQVGLGFFMYP